MKQKTIFELEEAFLRVIHKKGFLLDGIYQSTIRGDKKLMGKHLSLITREKQIKSRDKAYLAALVERYFGKIKKTVREQGRHRYGFGDTHYTRLTFEFKTTEDAT